MRSPTTAPGSMNFATTRSCPAVPAADSFSSRLDSVFGSLNHSLSNTDRRLQSTHPISDRSAPVDSVKEGEPRGKGAKPLPPERKSADREAWTPVASNNRETFRAKDITGILKNSGNKVDGRSDDGVHKHRRKRSRSSDRVQFSSGKPDLGKPAIKSKIVSITEARDSDEFEGANSSRVLPSSIAEMRSPRQSGTQGESRDIGIERSHKYGRNVDRNGYTESRVRDGLDRGGRRRDDRAQSRQVLYTRDRVPRRFFDKSRYTHYSVQECNTSEGANIQAAYSFLNDLKKKREEKEHRASAENQDKVPRANESSSGFVFTRPTTNSSTAVQQRPDREDRRRRGAKYMPECVVGAAGRRGSRGARTSVSQGVGHAQENGEKAQPPNSQTNVHKPVSGARRKSASSKDKIVLGHLMAEDEEEA